MITLNLRRIQTFVAVAEFGSFRLAGEQLHRSSSAVSAHVIQLEHELGVPLFNRTTRKVSLTESGHALLLRCKAVLADLETTVRELHEESQVRRGRVAIGSTPAMLGTRLPPILASFQREHPGVHLSIKEGFAKDVYSQLSTGEIDFAIGPRIAGPSDIVFKPLIRSPFVVIVPAGMALPRNRTLALRVAMACPQIALPPETNSRQVIEMLFMQHGAAFTTHCEVKQLQTLFAMVEAGLGIAILPRLVVPHAKHGGYRIARLVDPAADQEICLVTLRGKRLSMPALTCSEAITLHMQAL